MTEENPRKTKQRVYAFDFDGTITRRDTLLEIIRFACGTRRLMLGAALYMPMLMLMKLRLYPNWKAKQKVFAHFFGGMEIEEFDRICRDFALFNKALLRPKAIDTIARALQEGSKVIIVSASIENWVRPFFSDFGDKVMVSCTRIDVRNGKLTGKFLTMNCYGSEKVKRIETAFPFRKTYELYAYGDTEGDKAMLNYADKGFYKPFRR